MYTSCIHIPCELKSDLIQVDSSVSNQDVIGTYMFDETSLNFSLGKDAGSSKLILNINGTLEIKDFTTKIFTYQNYDVLSYKHTSAKGTWEITEFKNQKVVELDIKFDRKFKDIRHKTNWEIYKKEDEIVLYNLFGDIDACSAARLFKME